MLLTRPTRRTPPVLVTACAAVLAAATACGTSSSTAGTTGSDSSPRPGRSASSGPAAVSTRAPGSCHASSLDPATTHPDPNCTPGATNPDVTQADIHQTVCVAGYTQKIRPPVSYTNALKKQQIIEYGYKDTTMSRYEEDHFIPLSIGGDPTDPRNLWPEPGASPNPKDQVEFALYKALCAGRITLAAAQKAITTDWTTAGSLAH
ncbi:hypothetical protein [Actinomadura harenae]|uniref:hypothetical protein n=1 Tax=Actinomadura harenae TaxID=2483351 RepID=UPI0018F3CA17|nr:hypothetical protein [Actinomadura harenae]